MCITQAVYDAFIAEMNELKECIEYNEQYLIKLKEEAGEGWVNLRKKREVAKIEEDTRQCEARTLEIRDKTEGVPIITYDLGSPVKNYKNTCCKTIWIKGSLGNMMEVSNPDYKGHIEMDRETVIGGMWQ